MSVKKENVDVKKIFDKYMRVTYRQFKKNLLYVTKQSLIEDKKISPDTENV